MPTPEEHLSNLATNAVHREQEIYQYQVNIDNYTLMLAKLPQGEWPAKIAKYKGMDPHSAEVPDSAVDLVTKYSYRDRLRQLLRSEKIEQSKSQLVLDALLAQLPTDQKDALLAAAKG